MSIREMIYLDAGDRLYRGFGRCWPAMVWEPAGDEWRTSNVVGPTDWCWSQPISQREAERCFPGSTKRPPPPGIAVRQELPSEDWIRCRPELFDDYDGPTMRLSPQEQAARDRYWNQIWNAAHPVR